MAKSRTVKTLTALVVSMTIGTFVLLALETQPIDPKAPELAARAESPASDALLATDVELQDDRWQRIVIHTDREGDGIAERCHFVIDDRGITPQDHWRRQSSPEHVAYRGGRDYDADSIGICVRADYTRDGGVSQQRLDDLKRLVAALQEGCRIDRGYVYFHSTFTNRRRPAPAFREALESALLTISR